MPEHEFHLPDPPEPDPPEHVDPLYERQAPLGLQSPVVALIGAGGVGCWTALALALGGVDELMIFDGDTVSLNNLNRLPLPEAVVGELKSVALVHWLETLRPKAHFTARGMFDPLIHSLSVNWIVCCTDSLKSRQSCYRYAQDLGANYLEIGADGERWTLSPAPPEFSTELEDQAGYSSVPIHVGPCMMAGAAAAYYILHNVRPIMSHSVNWVKGPIIRAYPNLGALKFESMSEVDLDDASGGVEFIPCPECDVKVQRDIILLIKHCREHFPEMGLAEAKARVEHQLEQIDAVEPIPLTDFDEGIKHEPHGGDWTQEEVASHEEWEQTEEGQAILNAADPVAEATRRVGEDGQEQPEE